MKCKHIALLIVMLSLAGFLLSVSPALASPETPPQAPAPPKPGPEMERIQFLIGVWDYVETYEKNPMMPQGGTGKGTYTARRGPGGLSIITEFKGTGPIGAMSGAEFLLWDEKEKAYKACGVANYMPGLIFSTGHWENDRLVFTGEMEESGMKLAMKYEYAGITPTSVRIDIYQGPVGGPLAKIVTTRATKRAPAPAKTTR